MLYVKNEKGELVLFNGLFVTQCQTCGRWLEMDSWVFIHDGEIDTDQVITSCGDCGVK